MGAMKPLNPLLSASSYLQLSPFFIPGSQPQLHPPWNSPLPQRLLIHLLLYALEKEKANRRKTIVLFSQFKFQQWAKGREGGRERWKERRDGGGSEENEGKTKLKGQKNIFFSKKDKLKLMERFIH